jgi:site-specific recombinase XerD
MNSILRRRQTATVPAVVPPTAPTEAEIWANLRQYAVDAHGAFAANSERALRSDIAIFTAWCAQEGRQGLPASPEAVAAFVDAVAVSRAPASVRRYISSVGTFHKAAGLANPCEAMKVNLALKRMHNAKGRAQVQASGLNEVHVRDLLKVRGGKHGNPLRDLRNRALLVVGYVTLCRESELVALRFDDLKVEADGFATIVIRRSKGDQEGRGATVPIPADAMQHLAKWITAARITNGALFRAVRHNGGIGGALDPNAVARIFKTMAAAAKLPADKDGKPLRISGHSVRIGGAQDLLRYKETLVAIMVAGRWKSPEMVGRYVKEQAARDSAANRIAAERVPF